MNLTARLAAFVAGLTYDDLDDSLRERARFFLLDALGVMLGGAAFHQANGERHLTHYLDALAPPGDATIVGSQRRTTPLMAAFANGVLCRVLECEDSSLTGRMHMSPAVMPAMLAIAETRGASGRRAMAAVIAAYEVAIRVAQAIQPAHWFAGFQATGTVGTIAAAAAAGSLLRLDAPTMGTALGIGGSILPLSNGDSGFKGHTVKTIHGGQAAMAGVQAAHLAMFGVTSGPLEGEPPRHHAFLYLMGDGKPDLKASVRGLGREWRLMDTAFKPFPVGHLIVGPLEIVFALQREHRFRAADVERVEITSYREAVHFTGGYTTPDTTATECFLSIPFCVAVAIMDGELTWRQRLAIRLKDPAVHELASRVTVTEDPAMTARYPREWPVTVTLHLNGDEAISRHLDDVMWSPSRPATWDDLAEKFISMAEPLIGGDSAARAMESVARLDDLDTLTPILELVRR